MYENNTHFKEIDGLELLSAEKEMELAKIIQSEKSSDSEKEQAVNTLVMHNVKLALGEARRYSRKSNVEIDELIGEAELGLVTAAWKYDPETFNTRFSTYATDWIRRNIRAAIYKDGQLTIPLHIVGQTAQYKQMIEADNSVSDEDIKKELKLTDEALQKVKAAQDVSTMSLNAPAAKTEDGDGEDLIERIEDEKSMSPMECVSVQEDYEILHSVINELDDMSRDIVISQFLAEDKAKLSELGKKYGVTGERVRQIKEKALETMKKKLAMKVRLG